MAKDCKRSTINITITMLYHNHNYFTTTIWLLLKSSRCTIAWSEKCLFSMIDNIRYILTKFHLSTMSSWSASSTMKFGKSICMRIFLIFIFVVIIDQNYCKNTSFHSEQYFEGDSKKQFQFFLRHEQILSQSCYKN